jgi:PEP-CTERM motif
MRRIIGRSVLAVLALFALATGDASAGSITYNIVNMPEYQGGYTVTGTITTDGTIGDVLGHITAWNIQFGGATLSSTSGISEIGPSVGVMASATELYLAQPQSELVFDGYDPSDFKLDAVIGWQLNGSSTEFAIQLGEDQGPVLYPGPTPNPNWVIATASVPEPSTLIMLGIATVCFVAYSRRLI